MWRSLACEYCSLVVKGLFQGYQLYRKLDWRRKGSNVIKSVPRNRVLQCVCENIRSFNKCEWKGSSRAWASWREWTSEVKDAISIRIAPTCGLNNNASGVCQASQRSSYHKVSFEGSRGIRYDELRRRIYFWWLPRVWIKERGGKEEGTKEEHWGWWKSYDWDHIGRLLPSRICDSITCTLLRASLNKVLNNRILKTGEEYTLWIDQIPSLWRELINRIIIRGFKCTSKMIWHG